MAGIENTLKAISDLDKILVEAAPLIKTGVSFGSLAAIFKLISDLSDLGTAVSAALPEIKDLDAVESAQIFSASYVVVKDVLAAYAK